MVLIEFSLTKEGRNWRREGQLTWLRSISLLWILLLMLRIRRNPCVTSTNRLVHNMASQKPTLFQFYIYIKDFICILEILLQHHLLMDNIHLFFFAFRTFEITQLLLGCLSWRLFLQKINRALRLGWLLGWSPLNFSTYDSTQIMKATIVTIKLIDFGVKEVD
jgi:hypothetical protein